MTPGPGHDARLLRRFGEAVGLAQRAMALREDVADGDDPPG
jgi:hypothetical protein